MQIIKKKDELKKTSSAVKSQEKTLGLVCTMGALDELQIKLIKRAVSENSVAIVSFLTSPKGEAPRNLLNDAEMLAGLNADILFAPQASEMYSAEALADANELDFGEEHAMGIRWIGSFVTNLFDAVDPTRAYFLEDDPQLTAFKLIAEGREVKLYVEPKN